MDTQRSDCIALYNLAFPGEPEAFTSAMFDRFYPDCIRTICENGKPISMLFSIPYPLLTEQGEQEAHYLYAVATHPDHRGKGLAARLLREEAQRYPVFLRPMTPSLFDFYKKVGFLPISPLCECEVTASNDAKGACRLLTATEYRAARAAFAPMPTCAPTEAFLSLYENGGGFVACGRNAVALYEKQDALILFKEFWGDTALAPHMAGFLGGKQAKLRYCHKDGTPFGVGVGIPAMTAFLAALD